MSRRNDRQVRRQSRSARAAEIKQQHKLKLQSESERKRKEAEETRRRREAERRAEAERQREIRMAQDRREYQRRERMKAERERRIGVKPQPELPWWWVERQNACWLDGWSPLHEALMENWERNRLRAERRQRRPAMLGTGTMSLLLMAAALGAHDSTPPWDR
jgi:hypothetical protein